MLEGDAQLIVVAGSDTIAATLTHYMYMLLCNPQHIEKVRTEVSPYLNADGAIQNQDLQYLEHLNVIISETLRLYPPMPTSLQRLTPPEGLEIGGTYIPGNTTV
jgi:cytochrome P450